MAAQPRDRGEESQPLWPDNGLDEDQHLRHSSSSSRSAREITLSQPQTRNRRTGMLVFLSLTFIITVLSLSFILSDYSYYASISNHKPEEPAHDHGHEEQPEHAQAEETPPSAADLAKDFILDPNWDFDAPPQVREFTWTVKDVRHNPDGVFRQMMLVNEQYPGPLVEVNEGDTLRVHLTNQATNATSIHWHGLYQNGTNHMDGTVGVTQCPIAPGTSFTYEFKVSGQSGTYWWHSHQALQSADGLHGPLVVHSKDERTSLQMIAYDSDRIIMVGDYYHDPTPGLLMKYLASDRENIEPVPDGALINGHGKRNCSKVPDRECDTAMRHVGFPRVDLEEGKSHRLRIINVGTFAEIQLSLDEHDFALTEVDGTDVQPVRFDRLTVLPGQRYSIIVESAKAPKNFWLRAKMLSACFQEKNKYLETDALAIFNAMSSPADLRNSVEPPTSKDWDFQVDVECRDMNTTGLVPVVPMNAPSQVDESFYLTSNFEIGSYRLSRGFFNTTSFRPNLKQPSLLRTIDGISQENATFLLQNIGRISKENTTLSRSDHAAAAWVNELAFHRDRELVIQTEGIATIDLLISNFDDGSHPFHLHGYKFFVLAQGHGYPPDNLTSTVSLENPLRRDTATVEHFGWALFRILADNAGMWAFHCHVGWHSEAGLLMQFLTRADEVGKLKVPETHRALCDAPLSALEKGAVPPDETFFVE